MQACSVGLQGCGTQGCGAAGFGAAGVTGVARLPACVVGCRAVELEGTLKNYTKVMPGSSKRAPTVFLGRFWESLEAWRGPAEGKITNICKIIDF